MAIDEGLARAGLKKDEVKRGYAPPPRIDSDPYGSSLTRRQNLETNTLSPGASLGILLGGAVVGALVVSALAADNDKRKHYD